MADLNVAAWREAFAGLVPDALRLGQRAEPRQRYWEEHLPSEPPARTWVAERDGAIVGLCHLGPSRDPDVPEAGEIYGMYAAPEALGTGVGSTLMTAAMDCLRAGPWSEAILWTLPGDHRAARFYRSWGWAPDGAAKTGHTPLGDLEEIRFRVTL
jgi:GNAT superfamily N-acetyltransferase